MLDIKFIRNNLEEVKAALLKRMKPEELNLEDLLNLDDKKRALIQELDVLKAQRNLDSKQRPSTQKIEKIKLNNQKIKELEEKLRELEEVFLDKLSALPNIPAPEVSAGGKENNKTIYTFKEAPEFDFEPKNHVDLATSLSLIDYERAVKISGSGFWAYTGLGAHLEWALLSYFIDFHTQNGYEFLIPPFMATEASAFISGHLPKFRDDLFWTQDKLCLNPTSEMMLGNYHREEILLEEDLPKKYFAYSPCFRREAGSYRQEERGMIRGHQFNKIEMFIFTTADKSWDFFTELENNARKLLEGLDLHFQISQLAAGDCSAAMAKTNDIEVFIPSMNIYKEVSSVSNALDYQARRGQVRYKNSHTNKNEFVHTLNGSGLATSRVIPAILEQNQRADGSVVVPTVLRPYLPGKISLITKKQISS